MDNPHFASILTWNSQCEKMAILRQRFVARRQKRKTGVQQEASALCHGKAGLGLLVESPGEYDSLSGERHDADDYSASIRSNSTSQNDERQDRTQTIDEPNNVDDAESQYSNVDGDPDDEASVVDITLIQCDCCKRSFAPKIYEKHFDRDGTPKCAIASEKKRGVFDAAKVQ